MKIFALVFLVCHGYAGAATLQGIVHDAQHRPIAGARVTMENRAAVSDGGGGFLFEGVAAGAHRITAEAEGFQTLQQTVIVAAGKAPVVHLQLEVAGVREAIEVSGEASRLNAQTSTVQTTVAPAEIAETAGADLTNSMAMITSFTPGAYMVHDMLHLRGGHQVNWFFDGIPVINTSIAANVAALINPKNVEELEIERGGFSSGYGDRTYGFFNVVTPSGFERNNEGDLILSGGNFGSTDDQINAGGHTQRFAWYAALDTNRSELGLATPAPQVIHDRAAGAGAFVSLLYNVNTRDQVRWIASLRDDRYQVPNTPEQQAAGVRDRELESDALTGLHWSHSFSGGVLFSLAPYFHVNAAHYAGGAQDSPFILDDNGKTAYAGARAVVQAQKKRHNARLGGEAWGQHTDTFFGLTANPGGSVLNQQQAHWADSTAVFAEDQYRPASWLTLDLGVRLTRYAGLENEHAADPRLGGAIRIPKLHWVLHGSYAYAYQPPPLDSLAGPALAFALDQGYGFVPLHGERDIQRDLGLSIPLHGWAIDIDRFHTSARNYLDHDAIGNSGLFIPLTDLAAIIRGTEAAIRSPRWRHTAQIRVAYSNQTIQGTGPITGGLLEFAERGFFPLDHDQRHTLSSVLSLTLPRRTWATTSYQFGSGFLNGDGPAHLPPHSTFDLSIGKHLGESWTLSASAINIANSRYLLDTSNTFGGTHYVNPRQIYGEVRYRFRF